MSHIWQLRSGADKRFKSGHPWVYSNELSSSPKGVEPGAPVELRDASGKFLARGYGNPHSLIAFRAMTRDEKIAEPCAAEAILETLLSAARLRTSLGLAPFSHRLSFGEADDLPGLVIDRYRLDAGQVFVVQAHTAGANRWMPQIAQILEKYVTWFAKQNAGEPDWNATGIVIRNDLSVRKLEGLEEETPRVLKELKGSDLARATIRVRPSIEGGDPVLFDVDLVQGQKTGFFLDQAANIQLAAIRLAHLKPQGAKLRILDLCCYVGQWGTQLARAFKAMGLDVEVVAVDASQGALDLARKNVERQGARCETVKGDVLRDLEKMEGGGFDLVVSDPPALIKGRKDIPAGTHAYLQLNTQVFRLIRAGGAVVSCSCSALLEEDEFLKALSKAAYRNRRKVRWAARGSQSADHPMLIEFPEGRYLKCWIGFVEA